MIYLSKILKAYGQKKRPWDLLGLSLSISPRLKSPGKMPVGLLQNNTVGDWNRQQLNVVHLKVGLEL